MAHGKAGTSKAVLAAATLFAFAGSGAWAADPVKPSTLKITRATIGEGPKLSDTVSVPKGTSAEVKKLTQKDSDTVYGVKVSLEQDCQQLDVTGPGGTKFSIGSSPESLKESQDGWRSEVEAAKKAPKNEWMRLDWRYSTRIKGAGTAGQLFSISKSGSYYSGGVHPNDSSALSTYDARTGQEVELSQLLSPTQMTALVDDIAARMDKLKDLGSEMYGVSDDKAGLRGSINHNFALSTDKSGKVKIDIAWESGMHALGRTMAHFTVDAPTDAQFRKAIGAD